ncbi:MAG: GGDEF domain-containing protein [Aquabacterium sp.]
MKPSQPISSRSLRLASRLGVPGALLLLTLVMSVFAAAVAAGALIAVRPEQILPGAVLAAAVAAVVTPLAGVLVLAFMSRLERTAQVLSDLAQPAGPGAAQNRRQFLVAAQREWARCQRHGEDAAMLLLDADHLPSLQKAHGREPVDTLMRDVIGQAAQTLRQTDLLARFGDEGLAVYLPRTDPLGALDVAERLRSAIETTVVRVKGEAVRTTVSVGVASTGPKTPSLDDLVRDAGVALQAAREAGRNCVRAAPIQQRRSGELPSKAAR